MLPATICTRDEIRRCFKGPYCTYRQHATRAAMIPMLSPFPAKHFGTPNRVQERSHLQSSGTLIVHASLRILSIKCNGLPPYLNSYMFLSVKATQSRCLGQSKSSTNTNRHELEASWFQYSSSSCRAAARFRVKPLTLAKLYTQHTGCTVMHHSCIMPNTLLPNAKHSRQTARRRTHLSAPCPPVLGRSRSCM